MPKFAIGIDLGTTYSCVAVYNQYSIVDIVTNDLGNRTTPSYVAYTANGRLIGESAKAQASLNPKNTIFDVKRLIGRRFEELEEEFKHIPFTVVNKNGVPKIEVGSFEFFK